MADETFAFCLQHKKEPWEARVRQVLAQWRGSDGGRYTQHYSPSKGDLRLALQSKESLDMVSSSSEQTITSRFANVSEPIVEAITGKRSASRPHLGVLHSPQSTQDQTTGPFHSTESNGDKDDPVRVVELERALSVRDGGGSFVVAEEDPWAKKRRMERAVRRREAKLRARGVPINSARLIRASAHTSRIA